MADRSAFVAMCFEWRGFPPCVQWRILGWRFLGGTFEVVCVHDAETVQGAEAMASLALMLYMEPLPTRPATALDLQEHWGRA